MSNTNDSIINISEDEIKRYTQQIFTENHSEIIGKTDPFNGERCFVLCSLEQLIGLLSQTKKNDKMIIQHTLNLLNSTRTIDEYKTFLRYMAPK